MWERLEILHDSGGSGLRGVRAVAVRAAAVGSGTVRTAAVTVFCIPVVGAGRGIWIFNFVNHTSVCSAGIHGDVVRWFLGMAVSVGEEDGIAMAEHDVVGAGAAVDGLVEIVAHRVGVGEDT